MIQKANRYSRYYRYIKPITGIPIVRTYGSTIFTLIAMIIFIFFAIKPTIETILVLQKKMEDSRNILRKVNKKVENLTLGKQNYDGLNPEIKSKIRAAIPDSIALKTLVENLENIAESNEASISALQIQPITVEPKVSTTASVLTEINFTFNVEGKYQNLVSFLQELKTNARLISVETIVLNKLEAGAITMSLTGKAYYIK